MVRRLAILLLMSVSITGCSQPQAVDSSSPVSNAVGNAVSDPENSISSSEPTVPSDQSIGSERPKSPIRPFNSPPPSSPQTPIRTAQIRDSSQGLLNAVSSGDLDRVEAILDDGASANARDRNGSALTIAAERGDLSMVRLLVERGANPDVENASGYTALARAVESGNSDMTRILIRAGASPNLAPESGILPLARAIESGNLEIARLLLEGEAIPNVETGSGTPALYRAVEAGNREMVGLLLSYGANPRVSFRGKTAIELAAERGDTEMIRLLRS